MYICIYAHIYIYIYIYIINKYTIYVIIMPARLYLGLQISNFTNNYKFI